MKRRNFKKFIFAINKSQQQNIRKSSGKIIILRGKDSVSYSLQEQIRVMTICTSICTLCDSLAKISNWLVRLARNAKNNEHQRGLFYFFAINHFCNAFNFISFE